MEPATKIICAIAAVIVLVTVTIHANSGEPTTTVVVEEPADAYREVASGEAPMSASPPSVPQSRSFEEQPGSRYQQFSDENLTGSPEPPEEDPLLVDDQLEDPEYVYIPPPQAGPSASVYAGDDDPSLSAWDMTDQEVLDQALSMMDNEQRASFRATWVMMNADERQAILDQMRMGLGGY